MIVNITVVFVDHDKKVCITIYFSKSRTTEFSIISKPLVICFSFALTQTVII